MESRWNGALSACCINHLSTDSVFTMQTNYRIPQQRFLQSAMPLLLRSTITNIAEIKCGRSSNLNLTSWHQSTCLSMGGSKPPRNRHTYRRPNLQCIPASFKSKGLTITKGPVLVLLQYHAVSLQRNVLSITYCHKRSTKYKGIQSANLQLRLCNYQ